MLVGLTANAIFYHDCEASLGVIERSKILFGWLRSYRDGSFRKPRGLLEERRLLILDDFLLMHAMLLDSIRKECNELGFNLSVLLASGFSESLADGQGKPELMDGFYLSSRLSPSQKLLKALAKTNAEIVLMGRFPVILETSLLEQPALNGRNFRVLIEDESPGKSKETVCDFYFNLQDAVLSGRTGTPVALETR